ncbi:MAG TPA: hypothetical protein VG756_20105 [Pseudonocardiaceae bacterium]|jgi:hypothetical protein|nr:hypothetical protein [Pseudonocardiaceae bacterium]
MRTSLLPAALIAALCLAPLATAASAAPAGPPTGGTPTCLIGEGQGMTKTLLCANVVTFGGNRAGFGRYTPGKPGATEKLTADIQFQADGDDSWQVLASSTAWGTGPVETTTRPVHPHGTGSLRACVTLTAASLPISRGGSPRVQSLCSAPEPN